MKSRYQPERDEDFTVLKIREVKSPESHKALGMLVNKMVII